MLKTYKYRIYPDKEVVGKLEWTLACCCETYNAALQERRDRYNITIRQHPNYYDLAWRKQAVKEHSISLYDQQNQLSLMKKERTEYLELTAAHLLNDVCNRIDKAFKRFFDRAKSGQTPGYPRFRSHKRYDSFCYPDKSGWKVEGKMLTLTRIGTIKMKLHRPIGGKIKTCTIKREGEHWYVTFSCEMEAKKLSLSYEDVGIDLGVTHLATLSTGETIEHPRHLRRADKKMKQLHQALSRKKKKPKSSKRREKAKVRLNRAYRKVRNQRADYLHKASRQLVNRYQVIVFEDLQTANLVKRPKPKQDEETKEYLPNGAAAKGGLNKSILDAGWSMFVNMVKSKAEEAGRTMLTVNPKYTSQICSGCGAVKKKTLDERWHSCECGTELDRDHNAAINILRLGQKELARIAVLKDAS